MSCWNREPGGSTRTRSEQEQNVSYCSAVSTQEDVSDSEVDSGFRSLFVKLAGDVRFSFPRLGS